VIQGNWMLAYYPRSVRYREIINHAQKTIRYQDYIAPPYRVLVNLNTRQWTMDFKQPLVRQAPLAALETLLKRFYGQEMDYYKE